MSLPVVPLMCEVAASILTFVVFSRSGDRDKGPPLVRKSLGGRGSYAAFRKLPAETLLPNPPDTECALATFDVTEGAFCLFSEQPIHNSGPVALFLPHLGRSIAENGLVLDGVAVPVLPGVEGESPPILIFRAPDRGVTFPLSFELAGDRKSSLLDVAGAVSARRPRREGLLGDALCGPASLGVNGL